VVTDPQAHKPRSSNQRPPRFHVRTGGASYESQSSQSLRSPYSSRVGEKMKKSLPNHERDKGEGDLLRYERFDVDPNIGNYSPKLFDEGLNRPDLGLSIWTVVWCSILLGCLGDLLYAPINGHVSRGTSLIRFRTFWCCVISVLVQTLKPFMIVSMAALVLASWVRLKWIVSSMIDDLSETDRILVGRLIRLPAFLF
jgi:hypothetical protein